MEHVKPPPEQQEVYQGVTAPKRKRVDEGTEIGEMPKVRLSCVLHWVVQGPAGGGTEACKACKQS